MDSLSPSTASPGGAGDLLAGDSRELLDRLPWGVLELAPNGTVTYLNATAAALWGLPAPAVLGHAPAQVQPAVLPRELLAALAHAPTEPTDYWLPHSGQWISQRTVPAPGQHRWVFWDNVTARKQVEASQQHSHELLLAAEAVAHTGSYEVDFTTGAFYFSDGLYRLFGEAPGAFVPSLELIDTRSHPEDVATVRQVLDEAVRTRQPYTYRRRIRRPTGEQRTLEAHGEVHSDAAGQPVALRGLVQDITERVQAEQELRASRELLRATIDSSLDMVQVFEAVRDEQGTVVDFTWVLNNAAAERMYGNVIGQRLCQLNPGVVEAGIFDAFRQVLETGVPDQREHHYVHEQFDGWFYQSTVKLGDGVATTTHDISTRKHLEQELREGKTLLQDIIDAPHIGLAVYRAVRDEAGLIVDFVHEYINRASREMLGEDFTGKRFTDHGENAQLQLAQLREVLETGRRNRYLREADFRGRHVWFAITNTPLDADRLVHTWEDVTERQQAQQEILRLKDELARQATDRYYSLFATMEEGVSILEMVYDEAGHPVDMRWVEVNPAFEKITGLTNVTGQLTSSFVPTEQYWLDAYHSVVQTGKSLRYENYHAGINQWYRTHTSRIGGPESRIVANVFEDITEHKRREEQLRHAAAAETFRLQLADALGPLTDPVAIQEAVTQLARRHFGADRCYYCEIEGGQAIIRRDAATAGLPSVAGTYPLYQFTLLQAAIEANQPFVVRDVREDPSVDENLRQLCVQLQVISYLNVPLIKNRQPAGVLCLVQSEPREWTAAEAALATEVAERTWTAVERARAEEALRASEDQFRAVANLVPDLLWRSTPDGDTTWFNQRWYEYTGQTPAEAAGYGWTDVIHPDDRADSAWRYRTAVASGEPLRQEQRIRSAQGEYRWFQVQALPVHNAQGEITAWFGAATDIHARKQAELALAASEQRLWALITNLPGAAVFIVDRELRYQLAQGDALRLVGFEPPDFAGRTVQEMVPPDQWPTYKASYEEALAGQAFEREHEQGGRTFLTRGVPLPGPGGTVQTVLAVSYDITERQQAEEALRLSEEKFRTLADTAPALIWFNNERGENQFVNQYFLDYIGHTHASIGGRAWHTLIHPDDAPSYLTSYQQAVQEQRRWHSRTRVRRHDGAWHWFDSFAHPLFKDGRFLGHVGVSTDITASVEAEAAVRASEEKYRTLFESMDQGFGIAEVLPPDDPASSPAADFRWLEVNPQFERLTGLPRADLLSGQTIRELLPQLEASWFERYGQVAATGEPAHFEQYEPAIGRWLDVHAFRVGHAADRRIAVLFTNTTERHQAEEALHLSELKYRTLFETMEQGFGIGQVLPADEATGQPMDYQWLEVNPQFERLTGLPRTGVLSQTTRQLVPELEEIWYERYGHVAATGETVSFESYSPALGCWFDVYAFALGTPAMRRVAVLFTNTTERKRAEMALRQAEERYREQLEQQVAERTRELRESRDLLQSVLDTSLISMSVLYAVRDEAGQIQDFRLGLVNKELERETGRTDLVGRLYAAEYPGIRQVGLFDLMLQTLATGQPHGMEYFYNHEGFDRWYTCQFVQMGDGVVATNLDITERKMAEQERLKNLRLLEQAEAVAGLGSWDYTLATGTMRWSEGMYHLFRLPAGSPVGPDYYLGAVLPEDFARAEGVVRQLTAGQDGFEETLRLRVEGQVKTVRMKAVVLRDDSGQAARVLGVDLDISHLQRLEADNLRLRLTQQRALFEAVQVAQEQERRRMAESLHNGIGQILYATKLRLDRLHAPLLDTEPALVAARREADQLLGEAIRQTRALSHELVPLVLEQFGLAAALQDIGRNLSTPQLPLHTAVLLDDSAGPLAPALQMALYRMAQELAQNIVKHAHGATEASLELETMPGWVVLRAEDNGPGFPPTITPGSGLGLRTIRDRVALLGGQLASGSLATGGAYVRIRIPLPDRPLPAG